MFTPAQDERYADSGRRTVVIGGRETSAHLRELRPVEKQRFAPATHALTVRHAAPPPKGAVIDFDGRPVRVVEVDDPNRDDPAMRRKFLRMLCIPAG